jgi:hypothetical protein
MKFWYKFLFLSVFVLAFVGCSDDREFINLYHPKDVQKNDKAEDGKVTQLQKHTVGKGVPIIIMCDRFSDKDITNGNYREATTWAMEGLFSVHPMKSLRDYFDVYEVTAVCNPNQSTTTDEDSIIITPIAIDVWRYENIVMEIIGEERLEDVTTIVLSNKEFQSSSTLGFSPDYYADIPTGDATAYISFPFGEGPMKDYFDKFYVDYHRHHTLLHEAIGHCFAKLADEYAADYEWIDPDYEKEHLMECQKHCVFRNVSLDSDVTKTYWADFAADSRYDFEKLGCYEGGYYQKKGVYRPTENSIMRCTTNYFNVISRVMIYKRCMNIDFGDSWKFNYEDFVTFELEKAKAAYQEDKERYPYGYSKSQRLGAPPRFVKMKAIR